MSILNRFVDRFSNRQREEDDDYFLDDEYYDDEEYYPEEEQPQPKKPSIFSRKDQGSGETKVGSFFSRGKVVPINGGNSSNMQVTMKKPVTLEDSRDICEDLLAGKAVVINLEGISTETAQRIIDFTMGAVYSMQGDLQMISKYIFIASPNSVELSGEFANDFAKIGVQASQPQMETRQRASGFTFNG